MYKSYTAACAGFSDIFMEKELTKPAAERMVKFVHLFAQLMDPAIKL